MKKLLAVSWWFPPLLNPRSIQVGKTLHALAKQGWHITVVTAGLRTLPIGQQQDEALLKAYESGVEIVRIPAPLTMRLAQIVRRLVPALAIQPDEQLLWARRVVAQLPRLIDISNYSALTTFGHPWSDHIIGGELKAAFDLPWLAHFSDPWADNPYNARLTAAQLARMRALEEATVLAADKLVFTTQPTVDLVMAKYPPEMAAKAAVVPHGYERKLADLSATDIRFDKGKLTLLHLGNLYSIRSPEPLFEALRLLRDRGAILPELEVVLVGALSQQGKWDQWLRTHQLDGCVRFYPPVPYFESLALGRQADVLLTIDAPNDQQSVFLPSKLVVYLALDKPILGISPEVGVTADLLHSLGMPVAPPSKPEQIAEAIAALHDQWKSGRLRISQKAAPIVESYRIENTTVQFEKILLEMMSKA